MKKKLVSLMLGTALAGAVFVKADNGMIVLPAYQSLRVIDGDTFETKERQIIRLEGVDAPEMGRCGSEEAKKALEKLINKKPLYIKIVYRDVYNRLSGLVYTREGSVGENLLKSGWAYYLYKNVKLDNFKNISDKARENAIGIFGSGCTETINKENSKCVIKANNRVGSNDKFYRFPGCGQYESTVVQTYLDDQWFCSEKEAIKAGYQKGPDCYQKSWK